MSEFAFVIRLTATFAVFYARLVSVPWILRRFYFDFFILLYISCFYFHFTFLWNDQGLIVFNVAFVLRVTCPSVWPALTVLELLSCPVQLCAACVIHH